ncbi:hypothetical protein BaRGS_00015739 [Batillaria attramentaria]|uniref:Uncharacterized protein n=1 Tax=Batillaria attramentaria TaxID=370345 RepID=A0ABD0L0R0_9CAEN
MACSCRAEKTYLLAGAEEVCRRIGLYIKQSPARPNPRHLFCNFQPVEISRERGYAEKDSCFTTNCGYDSVIHPPKLVQSGGQTVWDSRLLRTVVPVVQDTRMDVAALPVSLQSVFNPYLDWHGRHPNG